MSGLLAKSLQEGGSSDPRVESIELGQEIAEAAIAEGWNGKAAVTAIKKVVSFLDVSVQDVRKMLSQNARIAMETAKRYGATAAARLIATNGQAEADEIEDVDLNLTHPEPDPMLLLKILREVSSVLDSQPDSTWYWRWFWKGYIAAWAWIAPLSQCSLHSAPRFVPSTRWALRLICC